MTIEAEVDEKGNIRPKEPVTLPPGSRVLITVLETEGAETALLSEAALSADWDRPEEEAAWSHLGQGRHGRLRRLAKPAAR
jgi:predicted DNA-binding antitoxin AbrB/MazE fold protein